MERGRAPGADQRPDLRDPQREVVLARVADGSVDLERHPRGEVGRVPGGHLGRRDVPGTRPGHRGAEDERPREVQRDPDVGQGVLDRLIGTDLTPELAALLRVLHRVGQQPFAAAEQLCRCGEDRQVERTLGGLDVSRIPRRHGEQATGRVDRADELADRRDREAVLSEDVRPIGHVGVQGVRRVRGYGEGDDPIH